ncbi:MAG: DUF1653 domain-containing protein [Oscillospiraceae bacterium]
MTEKDLIPGTVVQHFKRQMLPPEQRTDNLKYLYEIICTAQHTETNDTLVIYKALYNGMIFARPLSMFLSETDMDKYPEATQKYRFEKIAE